jgi:hypothetical protein
LLCQTNKAQSDILPPRRFNRVHRPVPVQNFVKRSDEKSTRSEVLGNTFVHLNADQPHLRRPLPQQPNRSRQELRPHLQHNNHVAGIAIATDFERAYAERRSRQPGRPSMEYIPPARSAHYAHSEVGGVGFPGGSASCVSTRSQPAAFVSHRNRHRTGSRAHPMLDHHRLQYTDALVFAASPECSDRDSSKKNTLRSKSTFYPAVHFTSTGESIVDPSAPSTLNRSVESSQGLWRVSQRNRPNDGNDALSWAKQTPLLVCGPNSMISSQSDTIQEASFKAVTKMKPIKETDRQTNECSAVKSKDVSNSARMNWKRPTLDEFGRPIQGYSDEDTGREAEDGVRPRFEKNKPHETIGENLYERIESLILIDCHEADGARTEDTAGDSDDDSEVLEGDDEKEDDEPSEEEALHKHLELEEEAGKGFEKSDSIAFVQRDKLKASYVHCRSKEAGSTFKVIPKSVEESKAQSKRKRKPRPNNHCSSSD